MKIAMYSLTLRDKERFLTIFSSNSHRVIASLISSVLITCLIYFTLFLAKIIEFNITVFVGHLIAVIFVGLIAAYLKLLEYKLEMISYKESNIHDIVPNFLYTFLLGLSILYMLGYYLITVKNPDISIGTLTTLIILALIGSILLSYLFSSLWTWIYVFVLATISDIDWIAKFDEDAFYRVLPVKFYESKRYHTPLSLGVVDLLNYDQALKKFGKKKLQLLMINLMNEINISLRLVDLISRIDDGKKIVIIMNIPSASAYVPMQRVANIVKEFNVKHSLELQFKVYLKYYLPDMLTEFDLLKSEGDEIKIE